MQQTVHKAILTIKTQLRNKDLTDEAHLMTDLGFDSMGLVQLASELEKRFGRSLPFAQWIELSKDQPMTVGSLITYLSKV